MINIKKLDEKAIIPTRSHINDAGADLYSIEDIVIPPSSIATIKTGISIEIILFCITPVYSSSRIVSIPLDWITGFNHKF